MCEITQQESDFLDAMVNGICNHYDEWLNKEYRWPQNRNAKDEQSTVLIFNEHSKHLRRGYIEESIFNIFYWGGGDLAISRTAERTDFSNAIRNLNLPENEHASLDTILSMGNNRRLSRIAFWSKVLAAYKPGEFFIYDSRVAIALSYIALKLDDTPCYWIVPMDPGTSIRNRSFIGFENRSIGDVIQANQNAHHIQVGNDPNSCYHLYLELLKRLAEREEIQKRYKRLSPKIKAAYKKMFSFIKDKNERNHKSIMAHLEKMLFMMKESILQEYQPGHN